MHVALQLNMFQVEERGFYIRLVCNKGEGVAVSLYKVLESLTNFKVQNSNLATVSERFALTFTLKVTETFPIFILVLFLLQVIQLISCCFFFYFVTDNMFLLEQVRDCEQTMNLPNLKLWVTGALLNQGFEFITPLSS